MEEKKELIVVKQLPIIEEKLKELSKDIDEKVKTATSLIVNEDTIKEVKKVRAELNKQYKELEEQRKAVKKQVLAPYEAFEDIYGEYVSDKFKSAEKTLKTKIDSIENELREKRENEINDYFNEYAQELNIDWLDYSRANINITLSASMKSLKEEAKTFVDKVSDDLKLIDTQENKAKILVEYKKTLNVSNAITTVNDRIQKEKEELQKLEELAKIKQQEKETIKKVEEATTIEKPKMEAPKEVKEKKEPIFTMTFNVIGTKEELKGLKDYMDKVGLKYE